MPALLLLIKKHIKRNIDYWGKEHVERHRTHRVVVDSSVKKQQQLIATVTRAHYSS